LEPESDSIENGDPASTLQNDEAASTSISDQGKFIVPTHVEQWQLKIVHCPYPLGTMATNHSNIVPKFDPTAAIQRSFRADLNVYLTRSPAELELAQSVLLHQLSLITEAKALKEIPGGKLEKFIFFNKFPTEVQKLVWEQLLEHEQKVFMIEAFRTKTQHKSHKKIVNFRCSSGKLDILLTICAGSREVALKHRGLAGKFQLFRSLIALQMLLHGTATFKISSLQIYRDSWKN
jgi:2EXR family protein